MEIRLAQGADIPALLKLLRQVQEVHHRARPDIFRAGGRKYDEAALRALLPDKNRPIFVAAEDGMVLGYGFCIYKTYRDDPVLADQATLYIDDLCVEESCRGRHIGKALYRHIYDYARAMGCRSVTLNVWACNEKARKFYEACGLKPQKIGMEAILEENPC